MLRSAGVIAAFLGASAADAGGLDRSGQPIDIVFRPGRYVEASLAHRMPDVSGVDASGVGSGEVYRDLTDIGGAIKADIGGSWSLALVIDQPWGVEVDYPDGPFAYAGTFADADSLGVTGLMRYRIGDRFSIHGGVRAVDVEADVGLNGGAFGNLGYRWHANHDWGWGYVLGGAYEIPHIALRVALTYGSETRHELASIENFPAAGYHSTTEIVMPQSANLDFQTGITPRTLLYGSVRWVNWKNWSVAPEGLGLIGGGELVRFQSNAFTYRLGAARTLTERFSAAVEARHETAKTKAMEALDPYDGYTAVGIGGNYAFDSGIDVSVGLTLSFLGDASVVAPRPDGVHSRFEDNRAVAAAFRVGYSF